MVDGEVVSGEIGRRTGERRRVAACWTAA